MKNKQLKKAIIKYLETVTHEKYLSHEIFKNDIYISTTGYDYYMTIEDLKIILLENNIITFKQFFKR